MALKQEGQILSNGLRIYGNLHWWFSGCFFLFSYLFSCIWTAAPYIGLLFFLTGEGCLLIVCVIPHIFTAIDFILVIFSVIIGPFLSAQTLIPDISFLYFSVNMQSIIQDKTRTKRKTTEWVWGLTRGGDRLFVVSCFPCTQKFSSK